MNPYAESVERDNLMRHRANCVAHAVWGLYNAHEGQGESRRWEPVAPRALAPHQGSGMGAYLVEMDGAGIPANSAVPVVKASQPGMLTVRVPGVEALGIERHHVTLFRSDYEEALRTMPGAWAHAWRRFERSSFLLSPFGIVKTRRDKGTYFRVNTSTSDPLMCAALWLAEIVVEQFRGG